MDILDNLYSTLLNNCRKFGIWGDKVGTKMFEHIFTLFVKSINTMYIKKIYIYIYIIYIYIFFFLRSRVHHK